MEVQKVETNVNVHNNQPLQEVAKDVGVTGRGFMRVVLLTAITEALVLVGCTYHLLATVVKAIPATVGLISPRIPLTTSWESVYERHLAPVGSSIRLTIQTPRALLKARSMTVLAVLLLGISKRQMAALYGEGKNPEPAITVQPKAVEAQPEQKVEKVPESGVGLQIVEAPVSLRERVSTFVSAYRYPLLAATVAIAAACGIKVYCSKAKFVLHKDIVPGSSMAEIAEKLGLTAENRLNISDPKQFEITPENFNQPVSWTKIGDDIGVAFKYTCNDVGPAVHVEFLDSEHGDYNAGPAFYGVSMKLNREEGVDCTLRAEKLNRILGLDWPAYFERLTKLAAGETITIPHKGHPDVKVKLVS